MSEKLKTGEVKMQNNLTKKELDALCKWAKEFQIKDLDSEEKILNIKELEIDNSSFNLPEIKYFPKEFFKLASLDSFYIVGDKIKCNLKNIIKNIGKLTNLKNFNLTWRKNINKLPKEILSLNKLKNMRVNHDFDR